MDKHDKSFCVFSFFISILSFIFAGLDLAFFYKHLHQDILRSLVELILSCWLFYWGYRNAKNAIDCIRGDKT